MIVRRSAGAGQLSPDSGSHLATDDRSGGDQQRDVPMDRGHEDEQDPGDAVDQAASTFLRPFRRWMSSGTKIASRAIMMIPIPAPK